MSAFLGMSSFAAGPLVGALGTIALGYTRTWQILIGAVFPSIPTTQDTVVAIFSKPKQTNPLTPAMCARGGHRPGVAYLSKSSAPGGAPDGPALRELWLCADCVAQIRHDAAEN